MFPTSLKSQFSVYIFALEVITSHLLVAYWTFDTCRPTLFFSDHRETFHFQQMKEKKTLQRSANTFCTVKHKHPSEEQEEKQILKGGGLLILIGLVCLTRSVPFTVWRNGSVNNEGWNLLCGPVSRILKNSQQHPSIVSDFIGKNKYAKKMINFAFCTYLSKWVKCV